MTPVESGPELTEQLSPPGEQLPPYCDSHILSSPDHTYTAFNEPQPMVSPLTTDPHPGSNHPEAAASPPQGKKSGDLGLQSESGEIVVRRPVEDSVEGSLYIPVKTRVVPPPRQFAYDAPPIVESEKQIDGQLPGSVVGGEGQTDRHFAYDNPPLVGAERQLFSEFAYDASQVVADSSIGSGAVLHTDIDTPSDELPPPPPQEDFLSPNNHCQATNTLYVWK